MIDDGVAMSFTRAYALGLYHQRCGTATTPCRFTRFTHDDCHTAPATVPVNNASPFRSPGTPSRITRTRRSTTNNPPQIAPALTSPSAQLFPFVNQGPVDVSGGHHDAGDYSKYTINSASLVHYLMFAADSLPASRSLDNLGIPESGDGISDVLQEAKWEADFLAKMQDTDGGFYFLVYPQNREYESNVDARQGRSAGGLAEDHVGHRRLRGRAGPMRLVAAVQDRLIRRRPPLTCEKAKLGWQFLTNAIDAYGKNGAYQKITHYGDNLCRQRRTGLGRLRNVPGHRRSVASTRLLLPWFDPTDPATLRWGWWRMSECYGHAIRSYAFAVRRRQSLQPGQLECQLPGQVPGTNRRRRRRRCSSGRSKTPTAAAFPRTPSACEPPAGTSPPTRRSTSPWPTRFERQGRIT